VSYVVANATPSNLQLERIVSTFSEKHFSFFYVAIGVAARERPEDRKGLANGSAEQRRHRHAKTFALRIQQRRFDTGLGEPIATGARYVSMVSLMPSGLSSP
jgi:hypothetical protein